ncbi:nucleotidyltransferase family protein [Anaerobacillus sp. HL2]|nr:nucleotidyltransferase family protein [Anaerobacillus sp. HL2]
MNATGVVVEYNPFHNGHKLHIDESKFVTGADLVVAVMSGNFLQRGEPYF